VDFEVEPLVVALRIWVDSHVQIILLATRLNRQVEVAWLEERVEFNSTPRRRVHAWLLLRSLASFGQFGVDISKLVGNHHVLLSETQVEFEGVFGVVALVHDLLPQVVRAHDGLRDLAAEVESFYEEYLKGVGNSS